ncbi:glucose-6-phosphate dehydrogenase (plasmid) [Polymorphobacter megasporae]|nr:glucose-6-phosphate dehydrogenase [Polymorphobacter megasporae]
MTPTDRSNPAPRAVVGDPCTIVIFGAGGDMTKRLMIPALYNLARTGVLPEDFAIIGVDLAPNTASGWKGSLHAMLSTFVGDEHAEFRIDEIDEAVWQRLAERMTYLQGDITKPELYADIAKALDTLGEQFSTQDNAIFYLAVAGSYFATVVAQLAAANLTADAGTGHWRRVVVEKPFGHSLASAQALNRDILCSLREDQIFRIDHFLGKDTVQSIMALRFANGLFEPIWNRDRIDHVQITVAETVGVETRGRFYEATGALRDMVPNHVFTLLAMVTMEPPTGFDAASIRSRKADVFAAMATARPDQSVRGQYAAGTVRGRPVAAYRQDADVAAGSTVETYLAMELAIDNWRWAGVPFYFRTGKHLAARSTEIAIRFKQAPFAAFRDTPVGSLRPNWLVLSIAPDEGISLQFEVKRPGPVVDLAAVRMDFHYADWFPKEPNVGYETLIRDVMIGDQTLFMRADMVEQGWRIVEPVLDAWAADPGGPARYESGSDGPAAADALLARDGREWRAIGTSK